ncbi:hypothetical protein WA556_002898 [Blastocystis sp. ATCC 50177/Nand II]
MAELYYFKDAGRGEAIRLALALSGIEFKENSVNSSDWPAMKVKGLEDLSLPFGQLPLLKINGMNIVESTSILRYLSRKYITPDADEEMATTIDVMVEGWSEIISGYFAHLFSGPMVLYSWLYNECDSMLHHLETYYLRHNELVCFWDDM